MKFGLTIGAAAMCAISFAQFGDNFESETGSAAGTIITGQNGWYLPVAGSLDANVYTYTGNTYGFAANPNGNSQFLGGQSTGAAFVRAQHAVNFSSANAYTFSFDFNGMFLGQPGAAANNLGSFSLQPGPGSDYFQTLYAYNAGDLSPTTFNAQYGITTDPNGLAAGSAFGTFFSPGPEWNNLPMNHWFHQATTFDFVTNQVLQVSIQDLTAGGSVTTVNPIGWYLAGGANNVAGYTRPTDARFFVGGSGAAASAGNTMGFDNFNVSPVPEPASLAALGVGALALLRRRRKA